MDSTSLPALNATLNATSGVLLVIGYAMIRRKRVAAHKACMLSALCISAIFLGCYLYYHYRVGHVEYLGQGWIRPVYFTILISHILLAFSVVPLALTTAYRGLRNQLDRHRRLARWTLPIWLYVSITGVVIYFMLYQL
jgi:uncharacterized membrane protein YozB (DUF420 family)